MIGTYRRRRLEKAILEAGELKASYIAYYPIEALADLAPEARAMALRDFGDTYRGMRLKEFMKVAATDDFERIADFPTPAGALFLFGRKRDGAVVTVDCVSGCVINASLQLARYIPDPGRPDRAAVSRPAGRIPDRQASIYSLQFDVTDGLRLRLADIEGTFGEASPLWPCAEAMYVSTLDMSRGRMAIHRGIASASDFETEGTYAGMLGREGRLPAEWRHIMDRARNRTAIEAYETAILVHRGLDKPPSMP